MNHFFIAILIIFPDAKIICDQDYKISKFHIAAGNVFEKIPISYSAGRFLFLPDNYTIWFFHESQGRHNPLSPCI